MYPALQAHEHTSGSDGVSRYPACRGRGWPKEAHDAQVVSPLSVGPVVVPESHVRQVSTDVACIPVEYVPAPHCVHESPTGLYVPAAQTAHAVTHEEHDAPEAILHAVSALHTTHADDPIALPVYAGHAWQAVEPVRYEKYPAVHDTHADPVEYEPGAHCRRRQLAGTQRRRINFGTRIVRMRKTVLYHSPLGPLGPFGIKAIRSGASKCCWSM